VPLVVCPGAKWLVVASGGTQGASTTPGLCGQHGGCTQIGGCWASPVAPKGGPLGLWHLLAPMCGVPQGQMAGCGQWGTHWASSTPGLCGQHGWWGQCSRCLVAPFVANGGPLGDAVCTHCHGGTWGIGQQPSQGGAQQGFGSCGSPSNQSWLPQGAKGLPGLTNINHGRVLHASPPGAMQTRPVARATTCRLWCAGPNFAAVGSHKHQLHPLAPSKPTPPLTMHPEVSPTNSYSSAHTHLSTCGAKCPSRLAGAKLASQGHFECPRGLGPLGA